MPPAWFPARSLSGFRSRLALLDFVQVSGVLSPFLLGCPAVAVPIWCGFCHISGGWCQVRRHVGRVLIVNYQSIGQGSAKIQIKSDIPSGEENLTEKRSRLGTFNFSGRQFLYIRFSK